MEIFFSMSDILIDFNKLKKNLTKLRSIDPSVNVGAVIKANAYSHIGTELIKVLKESVEYYFVGTCDEAFNLACDFSFEEVDKQIMVMYSFTEEDLELLDVFNNIIYNISDLHALNLAVNYAKQINEKLRFIINKKKIKFNIQTKKIKFNLNIDSGMHFLGIKPEELNEVIHILKTNQDYLSIFAVNTHFATADELEGSNYYHDQIEVFKRALNELTENKVDFEAISYHNSASLIRNEYSFEEFNKLNIARIGIAMYGYYPSKEIEDNFKSIKLEPILTWSSTIISTKILQEGEKIGYGSSFNCLSETKIGIVPIGYYEGYSRNNSNLGHVIIGNKTYPVVGRVRMNMIAIDITTSDVKIGDKVKLINSVITANHIAKDTGTINYEVLTNIK
jgi:alanine racemase